MRFSVDAHAIGQNLTGNEVYVRNLLHGFAALDRTSEFVAYVSKGISAAAAAEVPQRFRRREVAANSLMRLGYDLANKVGEDRPNLLHVQYTAPLRCPVPIVVSIHDVSFLHRPEYFHWPRAAQLRWSVGRTVKRAAKIIAPSEFSRKSIEAAYNLPEGKVEAVPIAMSSLFRPMPRENAAAQVAKRLGIRGPYVLTVGDLQPRKNQIGLIRAFEQVVLANPQLTHRLVIVGQETWFSEKISAAARASQVADRIDFTGFVSDDDLLLLYNGCDLMAFPSFYEGFGLPVLEAMACGRAVVCSNTTAVPEVANAAALLFDPESADDMARAMRDILLDAELRLRMERLGLHRASLFTWERTARRTLEIYREVARGSKRQAAVERKVSYTRS